MRPVAAALIAIAVVVTGATAYLAFLPAHSGTVTFWDGTTVVGNARSYPVA